MLGIPRVFLSYAHEDQALAEKLYVDLAAMKANPWLDSECLLPGQDWRIAIEEQIRNTDFFIAILSNNSVSKKGYVQKELKIALDVLDEHPSNSIYLIPVRIDNCEIQEHRLKSIHYVDLFPSWADGFNKVRKSISYRKLRDAHPNNQELIDEFIKDTITPQLEYAIGDGDVELVAALLKKGANPNHIQNTYGSMLGYAVAETENRSIEYSLAKTLLEHGADVHITDCHGSSILSDVVYLNKTDITNLLIKYGADVNHKGHEGSTPLMQAAHYHSPDTLKILLENNASVNERNDVGNTALILACIDSGGGYDDIDKEEDLALKVVRLLVLYGANIELQNSLGETAASCAKYSGYNRVFQLLESKDC